MKAKSKSNFKGNLTFQNNIQISSKAEHVNSKPNKLKMA